MVGSLHPSASGSRSKCRGAPFFAPFSRVFSKRTKRTVLNVSLAFSKVFTSTDDDARRGVLVCRQRTEKTRTAAPTGAFDSRLRASVVGCAWRCSFCCPRADAAGGRCACGCSVVLCWCMALVAGVRTAAARPGMVANHINHRFMCTVSKVKIRSIGYTMAHLVRTLTVVGRIGCGRW